MAPRLEQPALCIYTEVHTAWTRRHRLRFAPPTGGLLHIHPQMKRKRCMNILKSIYFSSIIYNVVCHDVIYFNIDTIYKTQTQINAFIISKFMSYL